MAQRFRINREIRIQPQGHFGCLVMLLGLVGLGALAVVVLLPILGIALGVGLGLVVLGMLAVGYYRLRAWFRRLRGRGDEGKAGGAIYQAEVLDVGDHLDGEGDEPDESRRGQETGNVPHQRRTVEVRRRPPAP